MTLEKKISTPSSLFEAENVDGGNKKEAGNFSTFIKTKDFLDEKYVFRNFFLTKFFISGSLFVAVVVVVVFIAIFVVVVTTSLDPLIRLFSRSIRIIQLIRIKVGIKSDRLIGQNLI